MVGLMSTSTTLVLRHESIIPTSAIPGPATLARFHDTGRPMLFPEQTLPANEYSDHPLGYYDDAGRPRTSNRLIYLYTCALTGRTNAATRQQQAESLGIKDTDAVAKLAFNSLQVALITRIDKSFRNLCYRGLAPRLATYRIGQYLHEQATVTEDLYNDELAEIKKQRLHLESLPNAPINSIASSAENMVAKQMDLNLLDLEVLMAHAYNHLLDKPYRKK
jgi:hypothetical protein